MAIDGALSNGAPYFQMDTQFGFVVWDFSGSTGTFSDGEGSYVEFVDPELLASRDAAAASGDSGEMIAGIAGGLFLLIGAKLWEIIRDSMWRRSAAV